MQSFETPCRFPRLTAASRRLGRLSVFFSAAAAVLTIPAAADSDFAESAHVDDWLRHPVYGDPSFDSFQRLPGNPVHRGKPPYEWPVNGFFFEDPQSGHWYIYAGDYPKGYLQGGPVEQRVQARCSLHRSKDRGKTWEALGPVMTGDPAFFDRGGLTPDVSVLFADGRYHMAYDWATPDWPVHGSDGGIAYASAERPEGPWVRHPQSIRYNLQHHKTPLLGKYSRAYAPTLIRRANDWLLLGNMDCPPSWSLYVQTAPAPEGPWSEPVIVLAPDFDTFHPPLMEHYPSFVHDGWLYVPSTSVSGNRNFNIIDRVPLEKATDPAAWELFRHGSLWHAEDVENETSGLWGQVWSGQVDRHGMLRVMFNSRDSNGMGTINMAERPWNQPFRERGFVMNGHGVPSLTLLRRAFNSFQLDSSLRIRGTARLLWDYRGILGPDRLAAGNTLHPLALRNYRAIETKSDGKWRVLELAADGRENVLASGTLPAAQDWKLQLTRSGQGETSVSIGGQSVWRSQGTSNGPSILGWIADSNSHLAVDRFHVAGEPQPAVFTYHFNEALLGTGHPEGGIWEVVKGAGFRHGSGAVSKPTENAPRAKWNIHGSAATLWSPKGPDFGEAEILLDGKPMATLDLRAPAVVDTAPVWTSPALSSGPHAIVLRAKAGVRLPVDSLDVTQ